MSMALAIIAFWLGAALIWVAVHGTTAVKPWDVFRQITGAIEAS